MPIQAESPYALLRPHWRLVLAAFLGWFLDAFDQVALILLLPQIGQHFGVSLTAMGVVLTAQSLGRIAGNVGWGWLADRYGRKLTFMIGVIWFAAFSGLTGLAWSYVALIVIQLLFGVGFGGEWTASAALLMESVPDKARAVASSLMMAGYECGFFAAAAMQALLVPHFGWRSLFFVGIAPALLAIFIRVGVGESPVWLRLQKEKAAGRRRRHRARACGSTSPPCRLACSWRCCSSRRLRSTISTRRCSKPCTIGTSPRCSGAIAAYSIGSVAGKLLSGWTASRLGVRNTILVLLAISLAVLVPFTTSAFGLPVLVTAFVIGGSSSGVFALVPLYLSLRFADAVRSFGMGLAYSLAALSQAVATTALPATGQGARARPGDRGIRRPRNAGDGRCGVSANRGCFRAGKWRARRRVEGNFFLHRTKNAAIAEMAPQRSYVQHHSSRSRRLRKSSLRTFTHAERNRLRPLHARGEEKADRRHRRLRLRRPAGGHAPVQARHRARADRTAPTTTSSAAALPGVDGGARPIRQSPRRSARCSARNPTSR